MKKFRKIWDEKTNGFLIAHRELEPSAMYELFMKEFPDSGVSYYAIKTQLSRLDLRPKRPHGSTKARPLYSEQEKKGYLRIKVAQPNVWWPKAKWVYHETHPGTDWEERANYIFLDGDNRNFDPDNIERVPLCLMGVFNGLGGTGATAEETRLHLRLAMLKKAQFDAGEKVGLVAKHGSSRVFYSDQNERARLRNSRPEIRKRTNELARMRLQKMKAEEPEKYQAYLERQRSYKKKKRETE